MRVPAVVEAAVPVVEATLEAAAHPMARVEAEAHPAAGVEAVKRREDLVTKSLLNAPCLTELHLN